jgi:hypothetical protein
MGLSKELQVYTIPCSYCGEPYEYRGSVTDHTSYPCDECLALDPKDRPRRGRNWLTPLIVISALAALYWIVTS